MRKGALYHLSVGIAENGYPVSDNRTLNCEGVTTSHIEGGGTVMLYPFKLSRNAQLLKIDSDRNVKEKPEFYNMNGKSKIELYKIIYSSIKRLDSLFFSH